MLGRLREIDDELAQLPQQLKPLEVQVERGREIVEQSGQNNPLRLSLPRLLRQVERQQIENLGWLAGQQSINPAMVANAVAKLLLTTLGKVPAPGATTFPPYETLLPELVRVEDGGGMPVGMLESALLRKLFAQPWLAADPKMRAHIMENLKKEASNNARWLPDPKPQLMDEEGRSLVGEGAGAFGGYFSAAAVVAIGMHIYRLSPPTRAFSVLGNTLGILTDETHFKKLNTSFISSATTAERGRALMVVAYVHYIRSIQTGSYDREHGKIMDALASAEVALDSGKKRIDRLRDARSEIVMQSAGLIGIVMTVLAILIYVVYSLLTGDEPPVEPPR
jgi:hypothetical protein